jgi:hypothetical protein
MKAEVGGGPERAIDFQWFKPSLEGKESDNKTGIALDN